MEEQKKYGQQTQSGALVGTKRTEGFGERSIAGTNEKATTAVAEAAKTEIQAAYIMALQNKRDDFQVRDSIMRVCQNPYFAESALYRKPIGKTHIEGLSIRFAEEYMRLAGNMRASSKTIYDDEEVVITFVGVIDLETNMGYSREIKIEKKVERKNAYGRTVIAERINSSGQRIFIVEATEDEIRNKLGAETSKFIRDASLRLCPAHIKQEAEETIKATISGKIKEDPEAAKRRLVDAFSKLGVNPAELQKYVGDLNTLTPTQIENLRCDYTALKDGQTTWKELIGKEASDDEPKEKKPEPMKGNINNLKKGDSKTHTDVAEPVEATDIYHGFCLDITAANNQDELEETLRNIIEAKNTITQQQRDDLMAKIGEKEKELQ